MGPTTDVSLAAWQDTLDTNLTSAFLGPKYQVPAMIARSVLHLASDASSFITGTALLDDAASGRTLS